MAYSYKGSISFGLVYIPITLHNAVKHADIGFNMIDKKTMSRVKYKKTCADCDGREVKQEDIVKGYEYEDGKYVIFDDADFEKIKTKKDKNITIQSFVDIAEVDPLYFDKPYYVAPTGAEKAFAVLVSAMEQEGKAALAKTVLGSKETLILIRAKDGQMLLNTLFFYDEVTKNPAKEITDEGTEKELKLAKTIIEGMTESFNPQDYKDEYRAKLKEAIESKIAGKEIVAPKERSEGKIVDLMEALQKSLSLNKKGSKGAKATAKSISKTASKTALKTAKGGAEKGKTASNGRAKKASVK
ncbi:MAG: Ku protein [Clostridiales bacterium]|nr:Ku protein [Clostridiales bacterium]